MQFEKTPLLQKLLVEQLSLKVFCKENDINPQVAILNIRKEFTLIRNDYPKNTIAQDLGSSQVN